ncbi:MAG: AMIN domain-containing protein [Mojavia pulchra JT2-VF2]|jgi:hypothetical protein|uniref:AMIN domain-containing protein n=1 Tax=Mojavia pulchra JT2-VF2 TaxID=287848 RepID=A0A951PZN6_9NOST|nr:AMIN domain-containing protein [Mojavia pulchra JT2-VF2]
MNKGLKAKKFFQLCKQLFGISLFGLYAAIALEVSGSAAKPVAKKAQDSNNANVQIQTGKDTVTAPLGRLDDWRFNPKTLQLEFTLSVGATPHHFYLTQPPRIVVDLPNTKLGYVPTQQTYSGAIQRVRVSQLKADVTRIVLDLAPGSFVSPNQVQLQPKSKRNPTRWVLRTFITGYNNFSQQRNYSQPPNSIPPSPYNNLQPSNNLSPSPYNNLQAPSNIPLNLYNNPQAPSNLLPTTTNSQQPFFTLPPPSNYLPPITNNLQQPFVSVPPLIPNNPSQLPSSILPPPNFPNQPSNFNSPIARPDFPTPTVPNYPSNADEPRVIEFGQPLPIKR